MPHVNLLRRVICIMFSESSVSCYSEGVWLHGPALISLFVSITAHVNRAFIIIQRARVLVNTCSVSSDRPLSPPVVIVHPNPSSFRKRSTVSWGQRSRSRRLTTATPSNKSLHLVTMREQAFFRNVLVFEREIRFWCYCFLCYFCQYIDWKCSSVALKSTYKITRYPRVVIVN